MTNEQYLRWYVGMYAAARLEHAFWLRAKGIGYRTIGYRLGCGAERARQMVYKQGRRVSKALMRTKWHMETAS
jgi:hypothetical protein